MKPIYTILLIVLIVCSFSGCSTPEYSEDEEYSGVCDIPMDCESTIESEAISSEKIGNMPNKQ